MHDHYQYENVEHCSQIGSRFTFPLTRNMSFQIQRCRLSSVAHWLQWQLGLPKFFQWSWQRSECSCIHIQKALLNPEWMLQVLVRVVFSALSQIGSKCECLSHCKTLLVKPKPGVKLLAPALRLAAQTNAQQNCGWSILQLSKWRLCGKMFWHIWVKKSSGAWSSFITQQIFFCRSGWALRFENTTESCRGCLQKFVERARWSCASYSTRIFCDFKCAHKTQRIILFPNNTERAPSIRHQERKLDTILSACCQTFAPTTYKEGLGLYSMFGSLAQHCEALVSRVSMQGRKQWERSTWLYTGKVVHGESSDLDDANTILDTPDLTNMWC